MRYLLDTHTFIWFVSGNKELSSKARKAIEADNAINLISIASIWEMAIKYSMDRLELSTTFQKLADQITENDFAILPISFNDVLMLSSLPFHHRDPFDRMIIAQGLANSLTIISKDKSFSEYNTSLIW